MCGIAGSTTQANIEQMLDAIAHRGPDARGIADAGVIHGHVRLSLRDLSGASDQPYRYQGTTLSYNGELWNWRQLRDSLPGEFKTEGDTEVMAALLEQHGINGLKRAEGMFAFAWSKDNEHWLARDAFGRVPLYVAKVKGGYTWASERKAFPRNLKPIPVPPGYAFNLKSGEWLKWYSLPSQPTEISIIDRLRQGVADRLDADAPVCCLISGGLDSSAILALAKEQRGDVVAYTATFDTRSEDAKAAKRLCNELGVPLVKVPVEIGQEAIRRAIRAIEIPSKAQIEIATLCLPLAERISQDGFKACLSGEAADELFGGYGNFCIQASKDPGNVTRLRRAQLEKMSRGNFIRCNKVFMAHGVECRLPFMDQALVESAVNMSLMDSPTGKKALKSACKGILPEWCVNRKKETFQGGAGVSQNLARQITSPVRYYNAETKRLFGYLPRG